MHSLIVMATLAVLACALVIWVYSPVRQRHILLISATLIAATSLTLYLAFGRPDLEGRPATSQPAAQQAARGMMAEEFTLMERLSHDANDSDALIKLAALRLAQGRDLGGTRDLLQRALVIDKKDTRAQKLLSITERAIQRP